MHWNDGGWWWWIPMTVTMIVFWTLVIWAIVRLAGAPALQHPAPPELAQGPPADQPPVNNVVSDYT